MKPYLIKIPRASRVLLLEDSETRIAWFAERLPYLEVARTRDDAIALLAARVYDFIFLDHDLGLLDYAGRTGREGNGRDVAKFLSGTGWTGKNTVIHSWNPAGAAAMKDILRNACAIPFGQFEIEITP